MFKEVYKQALDKQNPKDGLLEEILLKSKSETLHKVKPKYNLTKITSWSASVAAALVIAVCFSVYPRLNGIHNERRAQDDLYQKQTEIAQKSENDAANEIVSESAAKAEQRSEDSAVVPESEMQKTKAAPENNSGKKALNNESDSNQQTTVADSEPKAELTGEEQASVITPKDVPEGDAIPACGGFPTDDDDVKKLPEDSEGNAGGGGGGAMARMMPAPANEVSDDSSAIAYSGDVIFDIASAINEAAIYITDAYINAEAYEQGGIWYVNFYTESEIVTVSLEAHNGALVELTRKNI